MKEDEKIMILLGGLYTNKHFRKLVSFFMICVMMFYGTSISAKAETRQTDNSYSSSEVRISDSTINTYVTNKSTKQVDVLRSARESNGTYSYYGWYDVGNEKDSMLIFSIKMRLYISKRITNHY